MKDSDHFGNTIIDFFPNDRKKETLKESEMYNEIGVDAVLRLE